MHIVNSDNKVIYHSFRIENRGISQGLVVQDAAEAVSDDPRGLPESGFDLELPGEAKAATMAGKGKILAIHIESLDKVALIDLELLKIARVVGVTPGPVELAGRRTISTSSRRKPTRVQHPSRDGQA